MSEEAKKIIKRILIEVGGCKYLYRSTVIGAIEACISNYGMKNQQKAMRLFVIGFFTFLITDKGNE